jgi:hypothetical protein
LLLASLSQWLWGSLGQLLNIAVKQVQVVVELFFFAQEPPSTYQLYLLPLAVAAELLILLVARQTLTAH